MANNAFQDWRRECEAVQREMDRLITAGRPQSPEERQVRQLQFTALIERRDAAARNLLQTTNRGDKLMSEAPHPAGESPAGLTP
jgi:hypothetical protein